MKILKSIPIIDIRESDLSELLRQYKQPAIDLVDACRDTFGWLSRIPSYPLLPISDLLSKRCLRKTNNPYLNEIQAFADILKINGIFTLNLSYEWGCTTGVFKSDQGANFIRVLDWPVPNLGANWMVVHHAGSCGEFFNITCPGMSGIFNALAPGRFTAALNQAPMRRHNTGLALDWIRNRAMAYQQTGLPPAHLLRQVFETAQNYAEAKHLLATIPVTLPVIYILSGMTNEEGCVIERLENDFVIHDMVAKDRVLAANHFQSHFNGIGKGWMPRAIESGARGEAMFALSTKATESQTLEWFQAPLANAASSLVMSANARTGKLLLRGVAGVEPVTQLFQLD